MRRNIGVAAVLLFSLAPALGQAPDSLPRQRQQPGGAGTSGGAKPSPELKQARRALRQACLEDIRALCTGTESGGGKIMMCLRSHSDQVSEGCKAATRHLRDVRRGA